MSVELTYTGDVSGISAADAATVIETVNAQDGETSSTSGTFSAERCSTLPDEEGVRLHIGISLSDADDSDYPHVKGDLAEFVAGLSVDFGTAAEIEAELTGEIA
jgi:hypothetical protein